MDILQLKQNVQVGHIGPSLEKGRLASVFYFALSAQESLDQDPYNQPALYLAKEGMRVFSLDLPAHGLGLNAIDAIQVWAQEFAEGRDPLSPFIEKVLYAIDKLLSKGFIIPEKIGFMGLSRGGLIGSLVAAKYQKVCALVHFAPLTKLTLAKEFESQRENSKAKALNLENHLEALCNKAIRFYIGNRDERVGTDRCFQLVQSLANAAYAQNRRSPPVEMIISPSIGHLGHGTGKETFEAGADWLGRKLGAIL